MDEVQAGKEFLHDVLLRQRPPYCVRVLHIEQQGFRKGGPEILAACGEEREGFRMAFRQADEPRQDCRLMETASADGLQQNECGQVDGHAVDVLSLFPGPTEQCCPFLWVSGGRRLQ